jgi:hypothetical protein
MRSDSSLRQWAVLCLSSGGLLLALTVSSTSFARDGGVVAKAAESPLWQLHRSHHDITIGGRIEPAARALRSLYANRAASAAIRARAALWLAQIAERKGAQREALGFISAVKGLSDAQSSLVIEAERLRQRIVSKEPLAEVRGPPPGTVRLSNGRAQLAFRRAERLLKFFHRVRVRPRIETIDAVLASKRRALEAAVVAYRAVIKLATARGQAIARFRIASLYHQMASELSFRRPPELLPAAARRLTLRMRVESEAYLRKALASYRKVKGKHQPWQRLAARESATLAGVLLERRAKKR